MVVVVAMVVFSSFCIYIFFFYTLLSLHGGTRLGQVLELVGRVGGVLELLGSCLVRRRMYGSSSSSNGSF